MHIDRGILAASPVLRPNFARQKDQPPKLPAHYSVKANGDAAEIYLYGAIGSSWFDEGITASQFAKDLKALGAVKSIDVRVNSPGGDVFEGRAIYNLLAGHPADITVYIDAEASSIASLIAMAGKQIHMAEGSLMMIHCAWGFAMGNASEMRNQADLLDVIDQTLVDTYVNRTRNAAKQVKSWMDAETWMNPAEAQARGFCDVIDEPMKVAAMSVDRAKFHCFRMPLVTHRPNRAAAAAALARVIKA